MPVRPRRRASASRYGCRFVKFGGLFLAVDTERLLGFRRDDRATRESLADQARTVQDVGVTRLELNPNYWLPELRTVLATLAQAVGDSCPTPELIASLQPKYRHAVDGHVASIEYFPEGYTDDPLLLPEYAINLAGDRIKASWLLLETDLLAFLRQPNSN